MTHKTEKLVTEI